jgi:hypothetical protein
MNNVDDEELEAGLIPKPPTRTLGEDYSIQGARSAGSMEAQHRAALEAAKNSGRALIPLPNGEMGFLDEHDEFLGDHAYMAGVHRSLFTDAAKLLKDPQPGWIYVWAAKYAPKGEKANAMTLAMIRSGRYFPVSIDEIDDTTDLPIESHTIGKYNCAGIVDVLLMAVPPQAQKMMYRWRAFEAKRRTNRYAGFTDFQKKVDEATKGLAYAEHEVKG